MATFTTQTKHTSSYAIQSKNTSSYSRQTRSLVNQFILKEDGGYLLLETGGKIILEQSVPSGGFSNQVKH